MSEIFNPVYHWAPTARRIDILREGLKVYSEPATHSAVNPDNGARIIGWPYLCFGLSPRGAWRLSGDIQDADGEIDWDLWEVRLVEGAEIHVREFWYPNFDELKVFTSIPPENCWLVGERAKPSAAEEKPKTTRKRTARKR